MKVSAIIPTFNNEMTIKKCIESLLNQTYGSLDIWLIDGESSDDTVKIAKKNLTNVITKKSTRSEARNLGIKMSDGQILFFVESDAYYPPNYVEICVKFLLDNKLASTLGVERTWNKNQNWVTKAEDAERIYAANTRNPMGGWFYRRKHIENSGLFKNIHIGEDVEFAKRFLKFGKIKWCKRTSWYHWMPSSLKVLAKKNYFSGTHLKYFLKHTPMAIVPVLKVFYIPLLIPASILIIYFLKPWVVMLLLFPLLLRYIKFILSSTAAKVPLRVSSSVIILWIIKSFARSAGVLLSLLKEEKNLSSKIAKQKY